MVSLAMELSRELTLPVWIQCLRERGPQEHGHLHGTHRRDGYGERLQDLRGCRSRPGARNGCDSFHDRGAGFRQRSAHQPSGDRQHPRGEHALYRSGGDQVAPSRGRPARSVHPRCRSRPGSGHRARRGKARDWLRLDELCRTWGRSHLPEPWVSHLRILGDLSRREARAVGPSRGGRVRLHTGRYRSVGHASNEARDACARRRTRPGVSSPRSFWRASRKSSRAKGIRT